MSNADATPGQNGGDSDCPDANLGQIWCVLDAPAAKTGEPPPSAIGLPKNFRTMADAWHRPPGANPPSTAGLATLNASGSAQFCKGQLQAMLKSVKTPMTIVDLRQECHGFVDLFQPLAGESTIAVGWYADRDWMNIGCDLVTVEVAENYNLDSLRAQHPLQVNEIKTVDKEGAICTVQTYPVEMTSWSTEEQQAQAVGSSYLRLPATDHVRPRDHVIDKFVAFDTNLPKDMWLHFHCRGGDGRTTTFLAMHDIINNAPQVSADDILTRQYLLGGINLGDSGDSTSFKYPYAVEREQLIRAFWLYVDQMKHDGSFHMTWSQWAATRKIPPPPPPQPPN